MAVSTDSIRRVRTNGGGPTLRVSKGSVDRSSLSRRSTILIQISIVTVLLVAWEFVPQIPGLQQLSPAFDPYFVSSPSRIAECIWGLFTGANGSVLIGPYLWLTVSSALVGTAIGMLLGSFAGLLLSNSESLNRILRPFLVAINATPRIALIPIIVLFFGASFETSVVSAVLVVFFVAFFNAFEGGRSVAPELVQNVQLLGGSRWQVVSRVRGPFALAWAFAVLPLAMTFGLISVVTAEILTGFKGIGSLLSIATSQANATLTFSLVIILAVVGVVTVTIADKIRDRVLHWWGK